ncbi:MAG: alpha/beta hydrolase [Lachnospiraceae bacterium]|nr:alpha/beta hydrolase [Lachnospiraceae bacterium]
MLATLSLTAAMVIGFFCWTAFYYKADDTAKAYLTSDTTLQEKGNLTILPEAGSTTAMIFYPGAKVEETAYLPLLERIREKAQITVIMVHMPLHLAFFDGNAADKVMQAYPDIRTWYISGHSLGGAMASQYAGRHADKIRGLILMGAYIYGDYPASGTLTLYGSLDTLARDKITYAENVVCIEGGNHAQFGNYGRQKGDSDATISREDQQAQAVRAITKFIDQGS